MNRKSIATFAVALLLIGGTGLLLNNLRTHQKLGLAGVKTVPLAGSNLVEVELPEDVLDYDSEPLEEEQIVVDYLPKDTSFGKRVYIAPDGMRTVANVVLMGTDRTSLHKPQFCLQGSGWIIDENTSKEVNVHMERPFPYELPVMKLFTSQVVDIGGQKVPVKGIYVYWFVSHDQFTAKHWERMWWMARDLFRTGVLQRWAYISFFSFCYPGQEEATFERMKKLIAASVPEFQLTPSVRETALARP
jgi:hypothetical protein